MIAASANQLVKVTDIFAGITEDYVGTNSLLALFNRNWHLFAEDNEERIATITRTSDPDLPAKIQCIIAQINNDFVNDARFDMPDDSRLNCTSLQRDILWNAHKLQLLPSIESIPHTPLKKPQLQQLDQRQGGGEKGGRKKDLKFDEHNVSELKRDKKFFRKVIQEHGLFDNNINKPMYSSNCEECGKYVYLGVCNNKCLRKDAHCKPEGTRKASLVRYKD